MPPWLSVSCFDRWRWLACLGLGLFLLLGLAVLFTPTHSAKRESSPAPILPLAHPALQSMPRQMLWAWERPEDLRWLPTDVGVAYVASAIKLKADVANRRLRAHPLRVRPDTAIMPIVHVDVSWREPPILSATQKARIVDEVVRVAQGQSVVQLDFEVRHSQKAFLQEVVAEIRHRLPAHMALSMTALASWCSGDYWLGQIQADEIVPMVFRMGTDQQNIRSQIRRDEGFPYANCNRAIGFAVDEPMLAARAARRYYFSAKAWDAASFAQAQREELSELTKMAQGKTDKALPP